MIPFILLQINPDILNFFALIIRWHQIVRRRQYLRDSHFVQIMHISSAFYRIFLMWLELMYLFTFVLKMRTESKKLFKPHLVVQRLRGYR